jgi:hypothetical protein
MKGVRSIVNAVLVTVLLKPMLRRAVARWRKEARESAEATLVIPAQELLETVLSAQLEPEAQSPEAAAEEVLDEGGRSIRRKLLIAVAVAGITAGSAYAIAALRRRRQAAARAQAGVAREPVAIPVDVPAGEAAAGDKLAATSPMS